MASIQYQVKYNNKHKEVRRMMADRTTGRAIVRNLMLNRKNSFEVEFEGKKVQLNFRDLIPGTYR